MISIFRTALFACALLSIVGCREASQTFKMSSELNIGVLYTADTLVLHVAKEKGFFQQEGLDVHLIPFQSAMERDSAFQAMELDGMCSDLVGSSLLKATGTDLRIILLSVGQERGVGRVAILASPKSDIKTAQDLKGKDIALSTNTVIEFIADQLLIANGIQPEEMRKTVVAKIPVRLNMLIEGQVDTAILPDPLAAYAETKGARVIIDDTNDNLGQAVLTFGIRSMNTKREALKKLVRAYNRAVDAINANPENYKIVLARITRLPDGIEGTYDVIRFPRNQIPTVQQVKRVQRWLFEKGLLPVDNLYEQIVTDAFLES